MSIRTRLTVLFVALAAMTVLASAVVGYRSTADRVQLEIDQTLRGALSRVVESGLDMRSCGALGVLDGASAEAGGGRRFDGGRRQFESPVSGLQCIDTFGAVIGMGDSDQRIPTATLPVDATDRMIARQRRNDRPTIGRIGPDGPKGPNGPNGGPGLRRDINGRSRPPGPPSPRSARGTQLALPDIRLRTVDIDGVSLRIATAAIRGGGAVMGARELDERNRILQGLRQRFIAIGVGVIAAAAALGALAARAFAQPIRALTGVTASIAADGALSDDTEIAASITRRRDEIGRLASSFALMLGSLRGARSQQRQLAQDAGHELRTPLTSLRTNVDVLTKYPDLPRERRQDILREMEAELRELSSLTDELLVLATDATPDDPVADVDLFDVTQRAVDRVKRRSGRVIEISGLPSTVRGRRIQISRAIDNVLANAAKFDSSGEPIEVSVDNDRVSVRDHGFGFAPKDIIRVFDRFYRSDAARQLPGTGLGLAIAADATRAHGGTATAANHPDGGAVVQLTFPGLRPTDGDSDAEPA